MDSSDGQMDGMGGWTVAMDRWMEREDGQTGGEDGMNRTAGKNEEGDDFFFSFLCYHFFSLIWSSLLRFRLHFLSLTLYSAI